MLDFTLYVITVLAIWSVLGLSLDLQFGLSGLVNFGQILPFAIGAYGVAIGVEFGLDAIAVIVAAVIAAPIVGWLVVQPAGRLSQDYWALVTLGASEAFRLIVHNVPDLAGGADGVLIGRFAEPWIGAALGVALLVFTIAVHIRIDRAPLGRMLRILREDPVMVAALGRDPKRLSALITAVAWAIAALAGALYAHVIGYVAPSSFMLVETFVIWTGLILGGAGSIRGVLLGSCLVQLISISSRFLADWTDISYDVVANLRLGLAGLILVLIFLFRPQGIIPERTRTTPLPQADR